MGMGLCNNCADIVVISDCCKPISPAGDHPMLQCPTDCSYDDCTLCFKDHSMHIHNPHWGVLSSHRR